jgi:hypothetical protein
MLIAFSTAILYLYFPRKKATNTLHRMFYCSSSPKSLAQAGLRYENPRKLSRYFSTCLAALCLTVTLSNAQNVTMQHNDIGRTGGNNDERILTPLNVNASSFGRLFSQSVDGQIYAQTLYVSALAIPGKGVHNVVFVATENDSVYAFDADNNGGIGAAPLWKVSLLDAAHGAAANATAVPEADLSSGDITPVVGITGTPVIDIETSTLYVVGKTKEKETYIQRLHAIDITTGTEKFGGPVVIAGSVPGGGNGSTGGMLKFDSKWENQRAGLLLLNGIVYIPFGAHGDNGAWHGWILSYDATTLHQTDAWCVSPNGIGGGIWMSGAGLAADNLNPSGTSPGGRIFVSTGNGTFDANPPYTNAMNFGDSLVRLDLANGEMKVADAFTPSNQDFLNSEDRDVSAGGVLVLPDQTGAHSHLLVQLGKEGRVYVADREHLGGFHSSDQLVGEFYLNSKSMGVWGMPAFGNDTVYVWGVTDSMKAFPVSAGRVATTPGQLTSVTAGFPSPTPSITSYNASDPMVWTLQTDNYGSGGQAILRAHDAKNIAKILYSSTTNAARDNPGVSVKFVVPTIANGKVYVGLNRKLSVFGLLGETQTAATPSISPAGTSFKGSITVGITDTTPNATIFYSTTGPATVSSTRYTGPFTISSTQTVSAIATASGFLQSLPASQRFTLQTQTLMPTFSLTPGSYVGAQTVTISDASANSTIYYAINSPASTSSTSAHGPVTLTVAQSETINAIATSPGLSASAQSNVSYTINSGSMVSFANGFSASAASMTFNGSTQLDDTRLQLNDGLQYEAGSAWFNTPVNVQGFSTNFSIQLSNAKADGITFTIQNAGLKALGPVGGGLGYGPIPVHATTGGIPKSVAIKFDLFDNNGEGKNSTGLYTHGSSPTVPSLDLTASGLDLHSGNAISAAVNYDGAKLTLTLTDGVANKTFTTSWIVNIPQVVGGNTAYIGFTGGTGSLSSSQKILSWSFTSNAPKQYPPTATPIIAPASGIYAGQQTVSITDLTPNATIFYALNGPASTSSTKYAGPFTVSSTTTVNAIAFAPNFSSSATATSVINLQTSSTSTPVNFTAGFLPVGLQFNGSAGVNGSRLKLTDAASRNEASSVFFRTPVNVTSFTTDFTFRLTDPAADGFTFTIQNRGLTAIGLYGSGLGYGAGVPAGPGGIIKSVAVKFDLFDNQGEGENSTGLYINGAAPALPAIPLGGNVNLHSGATFHVVMQYDGVSLAMTITDLLNSSHTYTYSWPVNIPATVGGNTAYVGFTAGTGSKTATQEILTWSFTK